jgi:hypothetical protein
MIAVIKLCNRCHAEPCLPQRLIGAQCRRIEQRLIARDYARRKRNERIDSQACNCGEQTCNGMRCHRADFHNRESRKDTSQPMREHAP